MPIRRSSSSSRTGMTLIELMVVVVILGIVSAVVIPSFSGSLTTTQLSGAGRDMASLLDFCYRSAISSGRVHALVINADRQSFDIVAEQPAQSSGASNVPSDEPQVKAPDVMDDPMQTPELGPVAIPGFIQRKLPEGIKLKQIAVFDQELSSTADGNVQLLFFPDGTAEYADLVLSDESGDQCTVSLDGLTGMIEVGEVGPEPKTSANGTDSASGGGAPS